MNLILENPNLNDLYQLNEFILTIIKKEDLQVDLIVEEIFVNIVNYSNAEFIAVNAVLENQILTLEFIDNGIEFNPLIKEDPKIPKTIEEAEIGGLGIYLTKKMADELEYQYINGENHLKIIKNVE
ncbi:ATP-binding protein [Methanobrevibacter sp.]